MRWDLPTRDPVRVSWWGVPHACAAGTDGIEANCCTDLPPYYSEVISGPKKYVLSFPLPEKYDLNLFVPKNTFRVPPVPKKYV